MLGILAIPFQDSPLPRTHRTNRTSPGRAGNTNGRARGRSAGAPSEIPRLGWWDILTRVWAEQSRDNISVIAAGVAYYMLFSLFPALTAMVSIFGLVADPATVERQLQSAGGLLPPQAQDLVFKQLHSIVTAPQSGLGVSLVVSLLIGLWTASAAVQNLLTALNIAYEEQENRSTLKFYGIALLFTLGGIIFLPLALGLVAIVPAVVELLPFGRFGEWVVLIVRWPALIALIMLALAVLYRFGPCRATPKWRWVSWGASVATVLWVGVSALFSLYVQNFADYNATYGSIGAVVVLLFWFYLTAYAVLIGAELNAEIEHQTLRDTTTGPEAPLGRRKAYMADTIGSPSS